MLRIKLTIILLVVGCLQLSANSISTGSKSDSLGENVLRRKLFPLIESILHDPIMSNAIANDRVLQQAGRDHRNRVQKSSRDCREAKCYSTALQWTPKEIQIAGDRLIASFMNQKKPDVWLKQLRASGAYARYDLSPDTTFIRDAWKEVSKGINRIFSVYVAGEKPRYETIDSISFDKNDPNFLGKIRDITAKLSEADRKVNMLNFWVTAALEVLRINERFEAARYEPLSEGENAATVAKIASTKWQNYPYTLLLVPGYGPEAPGIPLDSRGARRCQLAAERYKKGMAPFIMVSGGHAYPIHTPICESIEMKKYLIKQFGIPADVILIEPHARHTTTNLRNAVRLIYRLGIPDDRPALVVTDRSQTDMIIKMEARCIRELGYVPYQGVRNLNEIETIFYPVKTVSQTNIDDPLDP